uniref:Uncharacterized protein n=1 Tax=Anguilla anguilla TaxID=7936 RepID=A0A0E9VE85_ANGAN
MLALSTVAPTVRCCGVCNRGLD